MHNNPCMNMSGVVFMNHEIRSFTFNEGSEGLDDASSSVASIMTDVLSESSLLSDTSINTVQKKA